MAKFSADAVAVLRDEGSRNFLVDVGLTDTHLLFTAAQPGAMTVSDEAGKLRKFLKIGSSDPLADFGIDIDTEAVVLVNDQDLSIWHVNSSIQSFAKCLERFTDDCPFGGADVEPEELESLAAAFGRELTAIDPSSLEEDPGFWHDILFDIANGDYSADQFQ